MARTKTISVHTLIARDGDQCHYCSVTVTMPRRIKPYASDATVDHVIARARGGTDDMSNLVVACRECNEAKADRTVEDFKARPYRIDNAGAKLQEKPPPKPAPKPRQRAKRPERPVVMREYIDPKTLKPKGAYKVRAGTLAAMINGAGLPLPRGATLPPEDNPAPVFVHSANKPARRMTAIETAKWLRECAEKKGQPWPLA